jgi:hypothetical protein
MSSIPLPPLTRALRLAGGRGILKELPLQAATVEFQ